MNSKHVYIVVFIAICCCASLPSRSQGLIATMTAQLAKLELFLKETEQGYAILKKGLSTISDIKNGDLNLHTIFLQGYAVVNPAIKKWNTVSEAIRMETEMLNGCSAIKKQIQRDHVLSARSVQQVDDVYDQLSTLVLEDVEELTDLLSDGHWQMNDFQRIERMKQLIEEVSVKFKFYRQFSEKVAAISHNLSHEKSAIQQFNQFIQP